MTVAVGVDLGGTNLRAALIDLQREKIVAEARTWIDAILAGQQPDGWFGPAGLRTSLDGKPDMWPHMPVLNALQSYFEYSGDARVLQHGRRQRVKGLARLHDRQHPVGDCHRVLIFGRRR